MTETPKPKWTWSEWDSATGKYRGLFFSERMVVGYAGAGEIEHDLIPQMCEDLNAAEEQRHATEPGCGCVCHTGDGRCEFCGCASPECPCVAPEPRCICPKCKDVGDVERTGLADLTCPVHGVNATGPQVVTQITGHVGDRHASSIRREDCPHCSPGSADVNEVAGLEDAMIVEALRGSAFEPQKCPHDRYHVCAGCGRCADCGLRTWPNTHRHIYVPPPVRRGEEPRDG